MKAQKLYDLREETGFCAGTDLHRFFEEQTGDPSPKGRVEVDDAVAEKFIGMCEERVAKHAPSKANK